MKTLLHFLALCACTGVYAQNLVPNPGFETNSSCPNQINQVDLADGWSGWGVTPDYYHDCSNVSAPPFGVPFNNRGFQVPHGGSAYTGFFTFADGTVNFREFIGRELLQPLVPGQVYTVVLWVCSVEQLLGSHSTDKIGIRFTTAPHSFINPDTALNNGHVFATAVISDSVNWTLVSGSFTADSAYTHIGIGNYFDDANTTMIPGDPTSNYAYYLIDDICVAVDPQVCGIETGIQSHSPVESPGIYPNPATETFSIKGLASEKLVDIQVTDVTRREVLFIADVIANSQIVISNLRPGSYIVTLRCKDRIEQLRLVKSVF